MAEMDMAASANEPMSTMPAYRGGKAPGAPPADAAAAAFAAAKLLINRPRALAIRVFSCSASIKRFCLARLFWNQIFTCVSDSSSAVENSALSAMVKYCFLLNLCSKSFNCFVVNGVRGFLLLLCFLNWHLIGPPNR